MATLRDIKRRIKGVQNTQQITKAMKMVAAAKLRRAQEKIISARPYARKISELLNDLITEEDFNNPFIAQREIKNVAIVIATADRGLCGAFNTNIIKEAVGFADKLPANVTPGIFCIGKKGFDFFNRRDYEIINKKNWSIFKTRILIFIKYNG